MSGAVDCVTALVTVTLGSWLELEAPGTFGLHAEPVSATLQVGPAGAALEQALAVATRASATTGIRVGLASMFPTYRQASFYFTSILNSREIILACGNIDPPPGTR